MALKLQAATLSAPKLLIGGRLVDPKDGRTAPVIYPGTGEEVGRIALASAADVDEAAKIARQAFAQGPWSTKIGPHEKSRILWRLATLIRDHLEELAELETVDTGKPINETKGVEVPLAAEIYEYFAGWPSKLHGETIATRATALAMTLREPIGVVAAITPWNFPLLMSSWKIAAALACGNVVIHKPAEDTSLTALRIGELALEAGVPEGVLQVLPGLGHEAGAALVAHPLVDKVSFTGSTEVGRLIQREAAASMKRLTLELGGKSPNVVFADADLELAARGVVSGIFYNKGEVCSAGSRLLVEKSCKDALLEKVLARAAKLAEGQGDPLSPKTRLGPQTSQAQLETVLSYIEAGKAEGAKLLCGGARNEAVNGGRGYFVQPTIFDGVTSNMRIAREEIFGPVLAVSTFEDLEDAIRLGNDADYGLAAGVFTKDVKKALRAAKALKAGTVWVNTYTVFDAAIPFGGFKQSGFGRELGAQAIEGYTETKSVFVELA